MKSIEIKLLADCPEAIPELATLWLESFGKQWIPDANIKGAIETYETHLNRRALPITYVVFDGEKPIAMASLRDNDGIRDDLKPWLGSLIVHPDYRHKGIGELLINQVKQRTKKMGFSKLHLLAFDKTIPNWYVTLGWKTIGTDDYYQHKVTVMEIEV